MPAALSALRRLRPRPKPSAEGLGLCALWQTQAVPGVNLGGPNEKDTVETVPFFVRVRLPSGRQLGGIDSLWTGARWRTQSLSDSARLARRANKVQAAPESR